MSATVLTDTYLSAYSEFQATFTSSIDDPVTDSSSLIAATIQMNTILAVQSQILIFVYILNLESTPFFSTIFWPSVEDVEGRSPPHFYIE